jgi:hypothetical protein
MACLQNTEMENSMTDQDRKKLAVSFIEALRAGDGNGFRTTMADDVVWTLPGTSLVSGIAKGVGGILGRARYIVDYGANVAIQHIVLGYEGVALLLHNTGNRNGRLSMNTLRQFARSATERLLASIRTSLTSRWSMLISLDPIRVLNHLLVGFLGLHRDSQAENPPP